MPNLNYPDEPEGLIPEAELDEPAELTGPEGAEETAAEAEEAAREEAEENAEPADPEANLTPEELKRLELTGTDEDNDTEFLDEEALAELSAEEKFKHALSVAKMAGRMQRYDYQDTYYRKALRELKPLFDTVEKAKPRFKKIRRQMHNARANHRIAAYKRACELRDTAKTADDYAYAADQFAEIAEYDIKHKLKEKFTLPELYAEADKCTDCDVQEAFCRRKQESLLRMGKVKRIAGLVVLAGLAAAAVMFSRTPEFYLWKGNVQAVFGSPEKSWESYYESYQRKQDPKVYEKYLQFRYYAAASAADAGNTEEALETLYDLAAEGYSDSAALYAEIEQKALQALEVGDKITFSRVKWVVLEKQDTRLLLLKDSFVRKVPFQTDGSDVKWENSTVRDFLNHEYYEERFLETERKMVMETTHETPANRNSGIDGGPVTTDTMYLLSTEEAEQYLEVLKNTKEAWWLRTPGESPGTMSFVGENRVINSKGSGVYSDQIRVRPAVWVDTGVTVRDPEDGQTEDLKAGVDETEEADEMGDLDDPEEAAEAGKAAEGGNTKTTAAGAEADADAEGEK